MTWLHVHTTHSTDSTASMRRRGGPMPVRACQNACCLLLLQCLPGQLICDHLGNGGGPGGSMGGRAMLGLKPGGIPIPAFGGIGGIPGGICGRPIIPCGGIPICCMPGIPICCMPAFLIIIDPILGGCGGIGGGAAPPVPMPPMPAPAMPMPPMPAMPMPPMPPMPMPPIMGIGGGTPGAANGLPIDAPIVDAPNALVPTIPPAAVAENPPTATGLGLKLLTSLCFASNRSAAPPCLSPLLPSFL